MQNSVGKLLQWFERAGYGIAVWREGQYVPPGGWSASRPPIWCVLITQKPRHSLPSYGGILQGRKYRLIRGCEGQSLRDVLMRAQDKVTAKGCPNNYKDTTNVGEGAKT